MSTDIQMMDVHKTNQLLEAMRAQVDPLADEVIQELFARGEVGSKPARSRQPEICVPSWGSSSMSRSRSPMGPVS